MPKAATKRVLLKNARRKFAKKRRCVLFRADVCYDKSPPSTHSCTHPRPIHLPPRPLPCSLADCTPSAAHEQKRSHCTALGQGEAGVDFKSTSRPDADIQTKADANAQSSSTKDGTNTNTNININHKTDPKLNSSTETDIVDASRRCATRISA